MALYVSALKAVFPLAANKECVANYQIELHRVLPITETLFVHKHCAERTGGVRTDTGTVSMR